MGPLAVLWISAALAGAPAPAAPDRLPFEAFVFQPWRDGPAPAPAETVESLAQDTYLGGGGVAGPAALLGTGVNLVVEPALGAVATLLSHDAAARDSANITRSTASAYGKTLSYMGSFMLMWALSIPVWAGLVLAAPVLAGVVLAAARGFTPEALQAGAGLGLLLGAGGLTLAMLFAAVPWFLGRTLGITVGDLLFEKLGSARSAEERTREDQGELEKLLRQRAVGPLPSVRAGVLLSAVAGGVVEREMRWDGLPVAGPLITAVRAGGPLPDRLRAARLVAELGAAPEHLDTGARALLFARSALLSAAQGLLLTAVPVVGLGGLAFLVCAFIPTGAALPLGGTLLGGALVGAAALAALGALSGAAAFLAHALLPWTLALVAGQPGEGAAP
ncbi:MAG: hypothetical protein HY904_00035 [Deltaproteobacteria bacterium]|nr:hypothetical protein [Deltaproteobacteria bacterium]